MSRCKIESILRFALLVIGASGMAFGEEVTVDFEAEIAPLLLKHCVECHQGADPAGGLGLTTAEELRQGGDSGEAIDAMDVEASYLLQRVIDGEMPPEKQGRPQRLAEEEVSLLKRWLSQGARWPKARKLDYFERTNDTRAGRDWWSLQKVVRPDVPTLTPQPSNPIDAFVRSRLARNRITPAPKADRRTLIRRLYYDLIGLPPTEAEIERFVHDESPHAWETLVDRLLAMPQYGERWGRFWLDLARYADTSGYERDQEKKFAWKYRDWVIDALNEDLPYDQFILHQLAGDEIMDRTTESIVATGFLRLGTWNDEPNDPADYLYERLEDLVHTTSTAFLGLTVKCARCHSHKFDAITQDDYYRMAAAFWPGPIRTGRPRDLLGGPSADELGAVDVLAWTDIVAKAPPLHVLKNGERGHPLYEIEPASISSIPAMHRVFDPPPHEAKTSTRRLQLARWIADPENPLTFRVLVNRLWQHHFGKGIVRTPNNFGFLANPPTHPGLLDWLAAEFVSRGQKIKAMHRLILTSETWQQSSLHPDAESLRVRDPSNRLLWRSERRRLDAETLRDSLLTASGELDLTAGGAGFKPTISSEALEGLSKKDSAWQASPEKQQQRRSIYMYLKRGLLPPMMTAFDLCDPTQACGKRDVTIVPTQALVMLNNDFIHRRSEFLAESVMHATVDRSEQIGRVWSSILRRAPSEFELRRAQEHVDRQEHRFTSVLKSGAVGSPALPAVDSLRSSLALHVRAERAPIAIANPSGGVIMKDLSGKGHHAYQDDVSARPTWIADGIGGKSTLRFDGFGQHLQISGSLLSSEYCTIVCVAVDRGPAGHRELISNWNGGAGNSTSSIFLGLTGKQTVRFTDAFSPAGDIENRQSPFMLIAVNGAEGSAVFQNGKMIGKGAAIRSRRLDTDWVIGTQGNIGGEYWRGDIAEIQVYTRALTAPERVAVECQLADRYQLRLENRQAMKPKSPRLLALASLCHVLMNSNEFSYID